MLRAATGIAQAAVSPLTVEEATLQACLADRRCGLQFCDRDVYDGDLHHSANTLALLSMLCVLPL